MLAYFTKALILSTKKVFIELILGKFIGGVSERKNVEGVTELSTSGGQLLAKKYLWQNMALSLSSSLLGCLYQTTSFLCV
jgi:hypothetical protein